MKKSLNNISEKFVGFGHGPEVENLEADILKLQEKIDIMCDKLNAMANLYSKSRSECSRYRGLLGYQACNINKLNIRIDN